MTAALKLFLSKAVLDPCKVSLHVRINLVFDFTFLCFFPFFFSKEVVNVADH